MLHRSWIAMLVGIFKQRGTAPRGAVVAAHLTLVVSQGDPTVIVGIIDTGMQLSHPDLRGRLRIGFDTAQVGPIDVSAGPAA